MSEPQSADKVAEHVSRSDLGRVNKEFGVKQHT